MSEPENFLSRWSRLKREEEEAKAKAASSSSPSPGGGGSLAAGERRGVNTSDDSSKSPPPGSLREPTSPLQGEVKKEQGELKKEEAVFDLSSLPSLESITAETDIKAFLSPGVPAELRHAALRRAWSADPKIRDFVGLAEYAWDFNAPDSMPGFGPLEMTDELRRIARNIVGGVDPDAPPEKKETEVVAPAQEVAAADDAAPEPATDSTVHRNTDHAAMQAEQPTAEETDIRPIRRGGGALPS